MKKDLYEDLIMKYGEAQVVVAIEELSELQKELCKSLREKENKNAILEEMADVYIMLDQMKIWFMLDDAAIEQKIEEKNKRTKERFLNERL